MRYLIVVPDGAGDEPIEKLDTDVAFRTNLITLTGDGAYEDMIITDHSAGDISTEEADQLMKAVQGRFGDEKIKFYTGVSYRPVSYTNLRAHETRHDLVCRLLLEKKKK